MRVNSHGLYANANDDDNRAAELRLRVEGVSEGWHYTMEDAAHELLRPPHYLCNF